MKSALKNSPTAKEKFRSLGATTKVDVSNSGLERLDHLIGKMVDLCDNLVEGMDTASTTENVNSFYKLSQSLAGLTRSRVDIEKLNLEIKGIHDRACATIKAEIQTSLQGRPELVSELVEIVDSVHDQIEQ
jgi:hypothetical protein